MKPRAWRTGDAVIAAVEVKGDDISLFRSGHDPVKEGVRIQVVPICGKDPFCAGGASPKRLVCQIVQETCIRHNALNESARFCYHLLQRNFVALLLEQCRVCIPW